jgi:hypothetical protein
LHGVARFRLVEEIGVGELGDFLEDDELGHGVWDPRLYE